MPMPRTCQNCGSRALKRRSSTYPPLAPQPTHRRRACQSSCMLRLWPPHAHSRRTGQITTLSPNLPRDARLHSKIDALSFQMAKVTRFAGSGPADKVSLPEPIRTRDGPGQSRMVEQVVLKRSLSSGPVACCSWWRWRPQRLLACIWGTRAIGFLSTRTSLRLQHWWWHCRSHFCCRPRELETRLVGCIAFSPCGGFTYQLTSSKHSVFVPY